MATRSFLPADGHSQSQSNEVDEEIVSRMASSSVLTHQAPMIPDLFAMDPPIRDRLTTATSELQDATVDECRPFLTADLEDVDYNEYGVPHLDRQRHINFLRKNLGKLPAPFIAADASRPWIFYWCLNGMSLLGADVSTYRHNLIETARSIQNETGGFGGGFGQRSHLATTYAMILALAIVGGESAYEVIDRRAMWKWLCALKQRGGGFQMSIGGEVDVRGAYCAAVIITLLNLPLDLPADSPGWTADGSDLFTGLADYVRRCQTFEGGISGKPDAEAHGAYAFCALGCLAILDAPHRIFPRYLDIPRLISWLSSRQYAPEGGFCGRTNKLVDGCYSHWVGGCWPLIEASINGPSEVARSRSSYKNSRDLYCREGLIRYILCCGQDQSKRGGMRDKPSRGEVTTAHSKYDVSPHIDELQVFDEQDRVLSTDPVYVIPEEKREEIITYFLSKPGF